MKSTKLEKKRQAEIELLIENMETMGQVLPYKMELMAKLELLVAIKRNITALEEMLPPNKYKDKFDKVKLNFDKVLNKLTDNDFVKKLTKDVENIIEQVKSNKLV